MKDPRYTLALSGLALGVLAFTLALAAVMPVWVDEAHTHWLIRDGFGSIFGKLTEDVHPPLYFCLTSWLVSLFGQAPWTLRLVSPLAAAATVVVSYAVARHFTSRPWALAAAALFATHPLFIYYGSAARNYGLFLLLLTAALGAVIRSTQPGADRRSWVVLTGVLALLLNTHNLALFCFPALLAAGLWLAGQEWPRTGRRLLVAQLVAFATYLPWFLPAVQAEGGVAWIARFWTESDRWILPWRSLLNFGFGARFPEYLGPPGTITGAPVLGGLLTMTLLAAGVIWSRENVHGATAAQSPRAVGPALWLGAGSLLLLWLYSWIHRPVYLVGRYDLVALPCLVFLLCLGARAIGERLHRPAVGAGLLVLGLGLNIWGATQLWTKRHVNAPPPLDPVVAFMAAHGGGRDDLIVTRGQAAYLMLVYATDRTGWDRKFAPFPIGFGRHPGWYEAPLFLRDPVRLQADAVEISRQVTQALSAGRRVWLVGDGDAAVDEFLRTELRRLSVPDLAHSNPEMRVFALRLR